MPMLPVRFFFRPSRMFGGLLAAFAVAAATSVLIIPIPIPARLALAALLVALFARAGWRYFSPLGGAAVRGMEFTKDGQVAVLNTAGAHLDFGGVIYRFVSPTISTVVIQGGAESATSRRYAVILMPDSMDRENYRRLRLRLNGVTLPDDGDG